MKPVLLRSYTDVGEIELRGGDGRSLYGLAAPFGKGADIHENGMRFTEVIAPGAFAKTIQERGSKIPLHAMHESRKLPLGPVRSLVETSDGLVIEARISRTSAGDEVLELIKDGALRGLSIGFSPIGETWARGNKVRTLTEVRLHEISVVSAPAYQEAQIAAVRSEPPAPTGPSLDFYLRRLRLAQAQGTR